MLSYLTSKSTRDQITIAIDWNCTAQRQQEKICELSGGILKISDFSTWDPKLGWKMGMSEEEFNKWAWNNPDIQAQAEPYENFGNAVNEFRKFAKVIILTATPFRDICIRWHDYYEIRHDGIIFTDKKGDVEWDVLVDDNPFTAQEMWSQGRMIVRFFQLWNSHLIHIPCIENWYQFNLISVLARGVKENG